MAALLDAARDISSPALIHMLAALAPILEATQLLAAVDKLTAVSV